MLNLKCVHASMCVRMCVCVCVHMCACLCMCVCVCVRACVSAVCVGKNSKFHYFTGYRVTDMPDFHRSSHKFKIVYA